MDQNQIRLTVVHDDALLHVSEAGVRVVGDTEQMLLIMFFSIENVSRRKDF